MTEFYSVPDAILKLSYVLGILVCVLLSGASLEYRKQSAVRIYLVVMALCGTWLFFNLMTFLVVEPEVRAYFVRLRFICISLLPGFWLRFCLELFRKPHDRGRSSLISLASFILPVAITVACFVPDMHSLLVHDIRSFIAWGVPAVDWRVGALVQLHIVQAYGILFLCIGICLRGLKREGPSHRLYAIMLIVAISMYILPELAGFYFVPEVRFLGLPSLSQIPSIAFIYFILHRQQIVRTFSTSNDKLFESLPVPALLFSKEGGLCLFNSRAAELLRLTLTSVGSPLEEIIPRGVEGERPSRERGMKPYICEIDGDGLAPRYFEVSCSVIDVQGLFGQEFIMVSFAEVTEIKRNTLVNQRLMSVLSHDLLGNLSGLVSLSNQRHPQHWDLIAETSRSSVDLLKNVLLWTSSRGGFYSCQKEPFDLQELTSTVVSQSNSFLAPKQLKVQGTLLTESLVAFVDLKMFSAILRNLLSNAARFSPYGGIIELNCRLRGDFVEVTVEDQGPGMSPEVARTILEAEDRPVAQGSQGYGIGLFLVRQFVKMHEGQMEVSSNSHGGCCMKITFPVVPPPTFH